MPQEKIIQLLLDLLKIDEFSLQRDDLERISQEDWQALYHLATEQKVCPLLYHGLKEQNLLSAAPEDIQQALTELYYLNARRNARIVHQLGQIAEALRAASIPMIPLKGAYLAEAVYPNIALRQMNDIDLLVRKGDLAQTVEIFRGMGYQPLKPFSLNTKLSHHHLPEFSKPNATLVEIHWHIDLPENLPHFEISDFWDQARPIEVNGISLLSLSPEDVLLYICFHNAYHQFTINGLRPYCDIRAAIQRFSDELDWDLVLERTEKRGWERYVYPSLLLAREFVGAAIPNRVLDALKPDHSHTDSVCAFIRERTFAEKPFWEEMNQRIAVTTQMSVPQKMIFFLRRFFPSRFEIAEKFQVPPDWLSTLPRYPLQWVDLLTRHWKTMSDVHGGDHEQTKLAANVGQFLLWLSGDQ